MTQNKFEPLPKDIMLHRDSHGVFRGVAFAEFANVAAAQRAFSVYSDRLQVFRFPMFHDNQWSSSVRNCEWSTDGLLLNHNQMLVLEYRASAPRLCHIAAEYAPSQ